MGPGLIDKELGPVATTSSIRMNIKLNITNLKVYSMSYYLKF